MVVSWPPFKRLGLTGEQYHLRKLVSLVPMAAAAAWCFGPEYLLRASAMVAAAALARLALGRFSRARTGWALPLYEALLLSLVAMRALPWHTAWVLPVLVLAMRWLLGGTGTMAAVNAPAAVLAAFLVLMGDGAASLSAWKAPPWFGPAAGQYFLAGALPAALSVLAVLLLLRRLYKFRVFAAFSLPILFLSGLLVYTAPGWKAALGEQLLIVNGLLVTAGFLAVDESSTPRSGWGQTACGLASAAVFFLLARRNMLYQAVVWSAFIPSLAAPWLDAAATYRRALPRFAERPGAVD